MAIERGFEDGNLGVAESILQIGEQLFLSISAKFTEPRRVVDEHDKRRTLKSTGPCVLRNLRTRDRGPVFHQSFFPHGCAHTKTFHNLWYEIANGPVFVGVCADARLSRIA